MAQALAYVQLHRKDKTIEDEDDLEQLQTGRLTRRKDFIDKEEEARKSPNRVLYYRRNADYDRLIEVCSRKIAADPSSVRALLIRASSYLKKGTPRCWLSWDWTECHVCHSNRSCAFF
jgi:hypothetical protein